MVLQSGSSKLVFDISSKSREEIQSERSFWTIQSHKRYLRQQALDQSKYRRALWPFQQRSDSKFYCTFRRTRGGNCFGAAVRRDWNTQRARIMHGGGVRVVLSLYEDVCHTFISTTGRRKNIIDHIIGRRGNNILFAKFHHQKSKSASRSAIWNGQFVIPMMILRSILN